MLKFDIQLFGTTIDTASEKDIKITRLDDASGNLTVLYPVTKIKNVEGLEEALQKTLSTYDTTKTYGVGDIVINPNGDGIYKCNTAISTAEAWNENHWTLIATKNYTKLTNKSNSVEKGDSNLTEEYIVIGNGTNQVITSTISIVDNGTDTNYLTSDEDNLVIRANGNIILNDEDGDVVIGSQNTSNHFLQIHNILKNSAGDEIELPGDAGTLALSSEIKNGTLTIQANGTQKGTFSANQSSNTTINITAADLGLDAALTFVGVSTTAPKGPEGATVSGHTTWKKGDVVLYNNLEYVNITGTNTSAAAPNPNWEELGDGGSYALKTTKVEGTGVLGGGGTLVENRTITHNKILGEDNKKETADVYSVTIDAYGHITSATTATDLVKTDEATLSSGAVIIGDGNKKIKDTTVSISSGSTDDTISSTKNLVIQSGSNKEISFVSGGNATVKVPTVPGTLVETMAQSFTSGEIIVGSSATVVSGSGKNLSTATPSSSSTNNEVPTSLAVYNGLSGKLDSGTAKVQLTGDVTSSAVDLTNGTASIATTLANQPGLNAGVYTAVRVNTKGLVTAGAINEELRSAVTDATYNAMSNEEKALYNSTSQGGYHYPIKPSADLAVGGICYMEVYTD